MSMSVKYGHSLNISSVQHPLQQQTRSSQAPTCAFSAGWLELCFKPVSMHLHFHLLWGRASSHKYYESQADGWKPLVYVLRIIYHHYDVTLCKKSTLQELYRTKLHWKHTTGKHFELFKELRKLSPNPIFSNSVTTTTKPSYMTNSVVLKSRKWQGKDIPRLFHNSV